MVVGGMWVAGEVVSWAAGGGGACAGRVFAGLWFTSALLLGAGSLVFLRFLVFFCLFFLNRHRFGNRCCLWRLKCPAPFNFKWFLAPPQPLMPHSSHLTIPQLPFPIPFPLAALTWHSRLVFAPLTSNGFCLGERWLSDFLGASGHFSMIFPSQRVFTFVLFAIHLYL